MTVPAVIDVCLPHALHCHTLRRCSTPIEPDPHARQQYPPGQRDSNKYARHASSSAKRRWNSRIDPGHDGRATTTNVRSSPDGTNRIRMTPVLPTDLGGALL